MRNRRDYASLLFIIYGNMALYGFVQTMRGVVYPLIKSNYGASYSEQGLLVLLVQVVMVFSCVVSGIMLGRAGFLKTIILGFGVTAAGMTLFRCADSYWIAGGFLLLIQLGFGFFEIGINGIGVQTFVKNSALMMNLLHFFYGLGAALGPWFGGLVANSPRFGWRNIYLLSLVPAGIMALLTFFLYPRESGRAPAGKGEDASASAGGNAAAPAAETGEEFSFRQAVSNRLVWRIAACLGFVGILEFGTTNWSGLYLLDVFGLDPKTTGATFVTIYFLFFTVSRLLGGFVIEKIGYMRSLFCGIGATVVVLIAGFVLGRNGIWLLPVTGLFLGMAFPTVLAVSIGLFGKNARAASSAIIVISFSLNGIFQYLIGLINRFIGEAWGYRSNVLFGIVLLILLAGLQKTVRERSARPVRG